MANVIAFRCNAGANSRCPYRDALATLVEDDLNEGRYRYRALVDKTDERLGLSVWWGIKTTSRRQSAFPCNYNSKERLSQFGELPVESGKNNGTQGGVG